MKAIRSAIEKNKGLASVLALLAALLLLYLIGPIRLCFVPSGSMEPNVPTWSLCFINIRVPYENVEVGDIVVYNRKSDGMRIIHRVIEIREDSLVTKGDANRIDDGPSVSRENLYGKYLFHIPGVGKPLYYAKTPAGIAVTAVVFVALLFLVAREDRAEARGKDRGKGP